MSRVLILGIDGYIGYPLALHLLDNGYQVCGLDNLSRRKFVSQAGSDSLTPIPHFASRERYLREHSNFIDSIACINLSDSYLTSRVLREYKPDVIVHLAEQPSAPWSMKNVRTCIDTQVANIAGTLSLLWAMKNNCPDAHLIKLGTMGEYGTPNCDIPEGEIPEDCLDGCMEVTQAIYGEIEKEEVCKCPMSGLLFPRSPVSFYHASKVHDTYNIHFACKTWGLRSTDIMQGVVFGINDTTDVMRMTRFDYDEYFGTIINRFCAQALIDHPLTVYGSGKQTRGFLTLKDSIQCLTLAIENPPAFGEYRTFNQFENIYQLNELAEIVREAAVIAGLGLVEIKHFKNPRTEADEHYYNPAHEKLLNLGYKPTTNIEKEVYELIQSIKPFKDLVKQTVIMPSTTWTGGESNGY